MGVSPRIADWLRLRGYDVAHLREEGLHRLPNGEIFVKAAAERRVILTFDLDFAEIVALSGGRLVSVVLFRLHNTSTAHVQARLEAVLSGAAQALEKGAIVVVEEGRHRIRSLPLGE